MQSTPLRILQDYSTNVRGAKLLLLTGRYTDEHLGVRHVTAAIHKQRNAPRGLPNTCSMSITDLGLRFGAEAGRGRCDFLRI